MPAITAFDSWGFICAIRIPARSPASFRRDIRSGSPSHTALDGVTGTRRVIAWWAILGVLAVYFAAKRLIGPIPAAAAAGLLCVHVIQTWYARYPNSEIVTQALMFPALLAHAYAHEDDDAFFGPIAASLLGLALFTRLPVAIALGSDCRGVTARARHRPSTSRADFSSR